MSNIFPKYANRLPLQIIVYLFVLGGLATAGATSYMTPKYTRVGYQPIQPVPFSHAKHVGELGMDCRYCHSNVEKSGHSNVPSSQTCMNCHNQVKKDSPLLAPVRASFETGDPVPWVWIHQAPDFVYFNHSIHVNRGVSCLECHRDPASHLREKGDVFNLDSPTIAAAEGDAKAAAFVHNWNINPPQSCS